MIGAILVTTFFNFIAFLILLFILQYLCHAHIKYNINCAPIYNMIELRFMQIARELGIKYDIKKDLDALRAQLNKSIDLDYLISRGEYLTAIMMAEYLGECLIIEGVAWL